MTFRVGCSLPLCITLGRPNPWSLAGAQLLEWPKVVQASSVEGDSYSCSPKSPQNMELGELAAAPRHHMVSWGATVGTQVVQTYTTSVRFTNSDLCPELLFFSSFSRNLFFWFYLFLLIYWCRRMVCRILVTWPGITLMPPAVEAREKPQGNSLELLFLGWFHCVCPSPFNFT